MIFNTENVNASSLQHTAGCFDYINMRVCVYVDTTYRYENLIKKLNVTDSNSKRGFIFIIIFF